MRSEDRWRKSSWSGGSGDCVEVRHDRLAVRDSKNPDGPTLVFPGPDALDALITWIAKVN